MKKSPTQTARKVFTPRPPKKTHQGAGRHSLPKARHKPYRGQGR